MTTPVRGLTPEQLSAIADLEARVVDADGGRLKLEWSTLRSRRGDRVEDVLAYDGDRLIGFAGAYAFGGAAVEITGMVDPTARRRGVGGALLDTLLAELASRDDPPATAGPLLVVPRGSAGGAALAAARGGQLHHCEHAMRRVGPPPEPSAAETQLAVRPAGPQDAAVVAQLLSTAFDVAHPADVVAGMLADDLTLLAAPAGDPGATPVATVRLTRTRGAGAADGTVGGIYGLAVDPAAQGRGVGSALLRHGVRELIAGGADTVTLEVAVDNERALGLYLRAGFTPVTTEDYYRVGPASAH